MVSVRYLASRKKTVLSNLRKEFQMQYLIIILKLAYLTPSACNVINIITICHLFYYFIATLLQTKFVIK